MATDLTLDQAKALFAEKKFENVISAIGDDIEDLSPELHRIRAESLWKLKRYEPALPSFAAAMRVLCGKVPFALFQQARTAIAKAGKPPEAVRDFWLSCADPVSTAMGELRKAVLVDPQPAHTESFRALAAQFLQDDEEVRIWTEAFDILSAALRGEAPPALPSDAVSTARPKVLVSGMGWSGSGAVYAFLSEFEEVFAVPGETTYLESPYGFANILKHADKHEALIAAALTFFFQGLLGRDQSENAASYKDIWVARRRTLSKTLGVAYAKGGLHVAKALAQLIVISAGKGGNAESLRGLADAIVDNLVAVDAGEGRYMLLDNCIHIVNIPLAQYLSNATTYCVMRDPRSNYVALKRENGGFAETVDEFIASQGRTRKSLLTKIAKTQADMASHESSRVVVVQFEDFVLSRQYRDIMVDQLGLDPSRQAAFSNFKPWESIRNAVLHEEYEHPEEIAAIREALFEHCREPVALTLDEARARFTVNRPIADSA